VLIAYLVPVLQVPNQQLHHLAANTGQRLPLHMQLNGNSHLAARPQAYSAGLANATYIPGTGLQYGGPPPHLQQRASIPHHAPDASYLQQDPNALAAAAAAAANAAVYKRTAGLPPHIQQQLLRGGQVLPNQAAPRPPNGLLFETNDIDLSGEAAHLPLSSDACRSSLCCGVIYLLLLCCGNVVVSNVGSSLSDCPRLASTAYQLKALQSLLTVSCPFE